MPSPFPGMDPYIESSHAWLGFHSAYVAACAQQLNQKLPKNYVARIEERLQVLSEDEERDLGVVADAAVARNETSRAVPASNSTSVATIEPYTIPQDIEWLDEPVETFVHIQRFPDERVVCALEVLSPSNKSGKGRSAYLAKRFEYRHQRVNLVELDLLLGGQRVPLLAPFPNGDYFALVTRAPTRQHCAVYAWSVRDPLPTIPVPLDSNEPDVALDLKDAFNQVWDGFRYEMIVRYREPPTRLTDADRAWVIDRAASRPAKR